MCFPSLCPFPKKIAPIKCDRKQCVHTARTFIAANNIFVLIEIAGSNYVNSRLSLNVFRSSFHGVYDTSLYRS